MAETIMNDNLNSFSIESSSKSTSSQEPIEEGLYPARIVGIQQVRYSWQGETKTGFQFIVQVHIDDDRVIHKTSKRFSMNLGNLSNLTKILSSILGCPCDENSVRVALSNAGILDDNGLDLNALVDLPCTVMLKQKISKKGKAYVDIDTYTKVSKKYPAVDVKEGTVPEWLFADSAFSTIIGSKLNPKIKRVEAIKEEDSVTESEEDYKPF